MMPLFNSGRASLRDMVQDLRTQQAQIVNSYDREQDESSDRISNVLGSLEACLEKLETVVKRLDDVTETLLEHTDVPTKPWYVRIFCP